MPLVETRHHADLRLERGRRPYVGGARWLGVRTRDLLERAGVRRGVDQILSHSTEGMTISTPVQALTDDREALVAVAMNGEPLPAVTASRPGSSPPASTGSSGRQVAHPHAGHDVRRRDGLLDRARLGHRRADPHPVPDRHPARPQPARAGRGRHGRRRLGPAAGHREGRGPRGRAALAAGPARPDAGIDYWRQWYLPWDALPGATSSPSARPTSR